MTKSGETPPVVQKSPVPPRRRRPLWFLFGGICGFALCLLVFPPCSRMPAAVPRSTDAPSGGEPGPPHAATQPTRWQIHLGNVAEVIPLEKIEELSGGALRFVHDDGLTMIIDEPLLREREKAARTTMREMMTTLFPDEAANASALYGIWICPDADTRVRPVDAELGGSLVVLVHGLDDPGKVWRELRPRLIDAGYAVADFEYPNDQPIADSARLFAKELEQLRTLGVQRVRIVAHSMGGLVSRQLLTSPKLYAGSGRQAETWPDITQLIMVGTPNHGSQMARFRWTAEVREQFERAFADSKVHLGSIFDGTGEAKIDLMPNSVFLTSLNARPLPNDVAITIIAGDAGPETSGRLKHLTEQLRDQYESGTIESADQFAGSIDELVTSLGDGCVTVESTRLDGVNDHVIVPGTHLSIIRNYTADSDRVPTAVPVILERLRQAGSVAGTK